MEMLTPISKSHGIKVVTSRNSPINRNVMKEHVRFLSQEINNNLKPTGSIILRPRMLSRDR
jgi:hypothetical protein